MRHAEVGQARLAGFGQQHVVGLDIAVNDVQAVRAGQRVGQIQRDVQYLLDRQRSALVQQGAQRSAADVFHDQIVAVAVLDRIEDRDDVRVIELPECFAFAPEAVHQVRVIGHDILVQQLDGDNLAGVCIEAAVDVAHAAPPDHHT